MVDVRSSARRHANRTHPTVYNTRPCLQQTDTTTSRCRGVQHKTYTRKLGSTPEHIVCIVRHHPCTLLVVKARRDGSSITLQPSPLPGRAAASRVRKSPPKQTIFSREVSDRPAEQALDTTVRTSYSGAGRRQQITPPTQVWMEQKLVEALKRTTTGVVAGELQQ